MDEDKLRVLAQKAREAASHAYCPYSRFPVGAAIEAETGEVYTGANIENASFGLTMCAERVALFAAKVAGANAIVSVVIYTPTQQPSTPCGACRQVLSELAPNANVICVCLTDAVFCSTVAALLPEQFKL